MVERRRLEQGGGAYFASPKPGKFIPTGCKLLDLSLGGGWARCKVGNVIGDKSTGKTLAMIEACANFARSEPRGKIRYREVESAFDQTYAEALGMPLDRVDFGNPDKPFETVEDLFEELEYRAEHSRQPELFIIDSLDAMTTRAEVKRRIDEGTFGADKPKLMGQLFRRLIRKMGAKDITLLVVSQMRDKIGVMFGRKWTRSGGRALDFYASQIVVLSQLGQVQQRIDGITRTTGIKIKAVVDKNKVSLAYRETEFPIRFGYGIDDIKAMQEWLTSIKEPFVKTAKREQLQELVERRWFEIESKFLPKERKYD